MSPQKVVPVNAGKQSTVSGPHNSGGLTFQGAKLDGTRAASTRNENSRGWFRFADSTNLTSPAFYPFTDLTAFDVNRFHNDGWIDTSALRWDHDGTFGWVRVATEVRKYSMNGGAALETLPMPYFGLAPIRTNGAEPWCFAPDKHNIYMAGNTTYSGTGTIIAGIRYGPIGSDPLPTLVDLTFECVTDFDHDIRCYTFINEICVDASTGHVFIMWDPEQQYQLPLFIDEYTATGAYVTRWIPRTSLAPAPGPLGDPQNYPPEAIALGSQGTSFYGPMCAANGFLYVNMDLYWSSDPVGAPGSPDFGLEDAIWRINTSTREGESEIWARLNRTPEEQAAVATVTPFLAMDTDGSRLVASYYHFWSTNGPLYQDIDVFEDATGARLLTASNPAIPLGLSHDNSCLDYSGNNRTGHYGNSFTFATYQVPGLIPFNTRAFETIDTNGAAPSVPGSVITGATWAIEFWVQGIQWALDVLAGTGPPRFPSEFIALDHETTPAGGFHLTAYKDGFSGGVSTPNGSWPNDGQARQVVLRKTSGAIEIYVNGSFVTSGAMPDISTPVTEVGFYAGAFVVTVDELSIYTDLSPTRIAAHYSAGTTEYTAYIAAVMADSPTGYYHLDDPGPSEFTIGQPRFVGGGHGPLVPSVAKSTRVLELQQNTVNAGKASVASP